MLPILLDIAQLARVASFCPLLMCVVLALASQRTPAHPDLRLHLLAPIRRLAFDVQESSRCPLQTVQALLILCWWPLEYEPTSSSPSWNYCGLAMQAALRLGLHQPHQAGDFVYKDSVNETSLAVRARIWAACTVVNQTMSCYLGVPATIPLVPSRVNDVSLKLPAVLEQHLEIAKLDHEVCQVLGFHESQVNGITQDLMAWFKIFDGQYEVLSARLANSCAQTSRVSLLKARLSLYSLLTTACLNHDPSISLPSSAVSHIVDSLKCAEALIRTATDAQSGSLLWPTSTRLAIYHATFYLIKLSASKWGFIDKGAAKRSIRVAWDALRNASRGTHDQFDRVCSAIEYMSTIGTETLYSTLVSVTSRMTSNIVYDTLHCAKQRHDERARTSRPSEVSRASEQESQPCQTLGLAGT
ncbi:Regulatory protein leu3 [Elasticomyces elasticus]|nr:Regulatory protein leu3 [Elasticomyces elasticus]